MSKKQKLKPNLDKKITKMHNMTVLQRLDPCVQEIITTAAHVVFYELNADTLKWKRKNVQGSLFVVKRSTEPWFHFIVMNHLHTEDLVESLVGDFLLEVHGPFLLYRNPSQEINGIWFYEENQCGEIAYLFSRILTNYSKVPIKSEVSPVKSEVDKDAFREPSFTTTSKTTDVPGGQSFVNISSTCQSSATAAPALQITVPDTSSSAPEPPPSPSSFIMSILTKKSSTNLVKPTSSPFSCPPPPSPFSCPPPPSIIPPITSSSATISPGNLKHPYGALLLHPVPPASSPQSLTPTSVSITTHAPIITREKVTKALQLLVQDDQFIDIVYRATMNAPEG